MMIKKEDHDITMLLMMRQSEKNIELFHLHENNILKVNPTSSMTAKDFNDNENYGDNDGDDDEVSKKTYRASLAAETSVN